MIKKQNQQQSNLRDILYGIIAIPVILYGMLKAKYQEDEEGNVKVSSHKPFSSVPKKQNQHQ